MRSSDITFQRAFPDYGRGIYRIDWFGDVTHTGRTGGRTPMIQIVVSSWQQSNSARTSRKHTPSFTTITIPIANLGLFRIGDLWNGGRKIGSDNCFAQETFRDLEINENTITIAPAGLPIHPDGVAALYPLPFSAFDAHRTHTGGNF